MVTSSRVRPGVGAQKRWVAANGASVPLPLVVVLFDVDATSGRERWRFEATVELVDGTPQATRYDLRNNEGFNPVFMEKMFRWGTPVHIVTSRIPLLIADGVDIWEAEMPIDARGSADEVTGRHSEEFLMKIVEEYERIGSGYAKELSALYGVAPRTVVSWMEKARKRGLAAPATQGRINRRSSDSTPPTSS